MSDSLIKLNARVAHLEHIVEELLAKPVVKVKRVSPDAVIPAYQTPGAAAMDLVACIPGNGKITLWPGEPAELVPTGIAIELPEGYEAQVRPRSGLSLKGVVVANSPGTVDEDYRGEVKVIMRNHGATHVVHHGDRIAQLVIARVRQAELVAVDELSTTKRGDGGFGSTGK
jgi:dUTP pyrophosphatase